MPKASEVAAELRKFAESLDSNPDAEIKDPSIYIYHWNAKDKAEFLALAKLLPHPLTKRLRGENRPEIVLEYETKALSIHASIPQSLTCTLIEPAKPAVYKCDPILSEEEDAALEVA